MLKQQTFDAIINYLATKPYQEVNHLFMMIMDDIKDETNKDTATELVTEE